MTTLELSDDEDAALVEHPRRAITENRFPHSPRLRILRAIIVELEPRAERPEPLPAPKMSERSMVAARAT